MHPLAELAELKETPVKISGYELIVREPDADESIAYAVLLRGTAGKGEPGNGDPKEAMAFLVQACALNLDGTKAFTIEDARAIARGRAHVFVPIISAILRTRDEDEKKSPSAPSNSSPTN